MRRFKMPGREPMSARRPGSTKKQRVDGSGDGEPKSGVKPAPIAVRIPQAIAMIGLSRSKLYEFIKAGDIEVIKIGRSTLIPVESLVQFIAARHA